MYPAFVRGALTLALREYVVGFRSFRRAVRRNDGTECPDPGL